MKLKNKKTGEVVDTLCEDMTKGITLFLDHHDGNPTTEHYDSLAELCEEWEDHKEPETIYYITGWGDVSPYEKDIDKSFNIDRKVMIGNYFKTREEAEKAIEKLKALKRLKDKGFEFTGWKGDEIEFANECPNEIKNIEEFESDLDLLFGGEE